MCLLIVFVLCLFYAYPSSDMVTPYMSEIFSNGSKATINQSILQVQLSVFHYFYWYHDISFFDWHQFVFFRFFEKKNFSIRSPKTNVYNLREYCRERCLSLTCTETHLMQLQAYTPAFPHIRSLVHAINCHSLELCLHFNDITNTILGYGRDCLVDVQNGLDVLFAP